MQINCLANTETKDNKKLIYAGSLSEFNMWLNNNSSVLFNYFFSMVCVFSQAIFFLTSSGKSFNQVQ